MGAALVALIFAPSCKPSETAYRDAYESAKAARQEADTEGYTPFAPNHRMVTAIENGDTIQAVYMPVAVIENGGGIRESLKPYSVVVGQFKQVFNARQMRERISQRGYPGAFVVRTGEPRYLVVAVSLPSASEAAAAMRDIKNDTLFRFHSPLPYILSRRNR